MFRKRKPVSQPEPAVEEKPTPAYLRDDYPYKAIGDPIENLAVLDNSSDVYEIWCDACKTAIRTQGVNIRSTYERLVSGNGCLGCGSKELVVRLVDMSKAPKPEADTGTTQEPTTNEQGE